MKNDTIFLVSYGIVVLFSWIDIGFVILSKIKEESLYTFYFHRELYFKYYMGDDFIKIRIFYTYMKLIFSKHIMFF